MEPSAGDLTMLATAAAAGAALQAGTGFGFAILAAPVFLTVLQSTSAVPILVALHVVQCLIIVPRIWNAIPWPEFKRLAVGALLGCPVGLLLFRYLDVRQLKLSVGLVILGVTALMIGRRARAAVAIAVPHDARSLQGASWHRTVTGALSGALTAVLVMPGPPLMVSLLRHPLPAASARALSIGFFAACYVAVLAVQGVTGEFDAAAGSIVAWLIAPVVLGTIAGLLGVCWLTDRYFAPLMTVLLFAAGIGAIVSAL